MATAVGRPLPDAMNREIIDVDEFEFNSPPQRHGERIYLIDSDGEEELIEIMSPRLQSSSISGNPPTRRFVPGGSRRNPSIPPPVPAIPVRFSAHPTSFPQRRHAQSTGLPNLPPVIPSQEPHAFELLGSSPARQSPSSPAPVAGPSTRRAEPSHAAAPPSHHTPSMGLGGALISSNRRESQQRQRAQLAAEVQRRNRAMLLSTFDQTSAAGSSAGSGSGSSGTRRRVIGGRWNTLAGQFGGLFGDEEGDAPSHQHIHMLVNGPIPPSSGTWATNWQDLATRHTTYSGSVDKEQYQQRYTHPMRPESGFTFDFDGAPESAPIVLDDDGEIIESEAPFASSSLVCARCMDPLVLNAAMDEEEATLRRLWALRCGHLIDEKCLNEIGRPDEEEAAAAVEPVPMKFDRKGKGKAKAAPFTPPVAEPAPLLPALEPEAGSIRSRLRSRIASTASALYSMAVAGPLPAEEPSASDSSPARPPPAKKRRVAGRKPKIEETFVWTCPVASCRREHVSVKVDGVWGPEKEVPPTGRKKAAAMTPITEPRGAIPVFA